MVYVELIIWLLLIVFCGIGIYRLWAQMLKPAWVNWVLLPATIVSEMSYIFGCLITGGEIRRARLIDKGGAKGGAEAGTEATPHWKVLGPLVASLLAILACGAAIGLADALLGEPVMKEFDFAGSLTGRASPWSAGGFWDALWLRLEGQLQLLKRMCETLLRLDWLNWRVPLFIYLAGCLSIRLAPVRRDLRSTLAAAGIVAVAAVAAGAVSTRFDQITSAVRPILTYVWGSLLLLLVISLLVRGLVGLMRVLSGKSSR